ncbi:MAG TPA: S8 family serine peptidase [Candidatus Eisenbacteria bacterium]
MNRIRAACRRGTSARLLPLWLLLATIGAGAPLPKHAPTDRYVEGEILIGFKADAPPGQVQAILRDLGAGRSHRFRRVNAERDHIAIPVETAIARYRNHPAVRFIEPNYIVHLDAVPNDPSFAIQWALRNTGQSNGLPGADIHVVPAWDQVTGSSQVIVAIVDTGVDLTHPDLVGNLYTNPGEIPGNELDDDGDGYVDDVHGFDFANFDGDPTDDNGHGTHVAGIIGAVGSNGIGISGVAWRVQLLPLKFLDRTGTGTTGDAIDAIEYAISHGAAIINASWGGGAFSEALRMALGEANDQGVLFVAASGNQGVDNDQFPNWPSNYDVPNVIAVASTDRVDGLSQFSNYGATTVDLAAPGSDILSTLKDGAYGVMSGTSMAAPHVSGALALLHARFPAMPGATMKRVLLAATDRIPALDGFTLTGGRLDVVRMMDGVDSIPPAPIADLKLLLASSDRVTVGWTATGDDGATGTATRYDLRYATSPLDAATFAAANRVAGVAAPRVAGSAERADIGGLAPRTTYYVAVVVSDEFGNAAPLSNAFSFTTTGPPVLDVSPASLATTLKTGARVSLPMSIRNAGEGALDFAVAAAGPAGAPPPPWLTVAPKSGSVPSGGSIAITVGVSAAGLAGGDYQGVIHVSANDPSRPTLDVPVAFHAVSAPDIDVFPVPITFGPVVVGATESQGILVQNVGFDDLHLTGVSVDNPQFVVDPTPLTLVPGDLAEIQLSVTPAAPGTITGTLTIESDDPDESPLRIAMGATGRVPPVVSVVPARSADTLRTGASLDRAFTIRNDGGSVLTWSTRVRAARTLLTDSLDTAAAAGDTTTAAGAGSTASADLRVESVATDPGVAPPADLSDVRILFDTIHGGDAGPWSGLIGSLSSRGVIFQGNNDAVRAPVLGGADVYWLSDATSPWASSGIEALASWVQGGGAVFLNGEASSALPIFNAILAAAGAPMHYAEAQGTPGPTARLLPHEITRGAAEANLPGTAARLVVDGPGAYPVLEDAAGAPVLVAAFVGRGRVLAGTGRFFEDVASIFADNRRVAEQSFDWLGGASWLGVSPPSASTAEGRTATITARFDARRLTGGDYHGAIVVRSNDPEREEFLVPLDLTVIAAPDAAVSPDSIAFGPVFVGATQRGTVTVTNQGVVPLVVASVTIDGAEFGVSPASFTVEPGGAQPIVVAYAPGAVQAARATLVIRSDDPDRPESRIFVTGNGLAPPEALAGPPTFDAAIPTGTTDSRLLTIGNRAGSDLVYAIRFEETTAAASAASATPTAGETAAARFERSWSALRADPLLGAARLALEAPGPAAPSGGTALAASDSLPLVLADPSDDGGVAEATELRASARAGVLRVSLRTATDIVPLNFGGYLSFDVDQNANTGRGPTFGGPGQVIGAEFEIGLFSIAFGYVDLFDAKTGTYLGSSPADVLPREIRFDLPLASLGGDDGRMNVSSVIGNAVAATDWMPDRGYGVIGGAWLGASPNHGTLVAGDQDAVALTIDARGLLAGDYAGRVIVETNDPKSPSLVMPATLRVADAPSFAASTQAIPFGNVFLGGSASSDLLVANPGTLPLHVTAGVAPEGEFTASPAALTIDPGSAGTLHLAFAPGSAGARAATLSLGHDAPQPPAAIALAGTGVPAPSLRVSPASLRTDVAVGRASTPILTIGNDGGSPLSFSAEAQNGAASVAVQDAVFYARDVEDPRVGDPVILGSGGPDSFGYRWVDSDQPSGPAFDWVEIRDVGTPVALSELDENSGPIPIGFEFPFYDRPFSTINVCTHGWLSFTNLGAAFQNQPLPNDNAPENLIAPFWDDLNFAQARRAFTWNDGTRLIVEFDHVPRRVSGGPYTFEAILYPSGAMLFQYLQMGPPVNSATVGIQSGAKTDGFPIVFNRDYLHDRLAIRIAPAPHWLSLFPLEGDVAPGGSAAMEVRTDAAGLFGGDYSGEVRLMTNDPVHRETAIPVTMHATGIPDLAVSPGGLAFDPLYVGQSATDTLHVTDAGTDRLHVTSIAAPGGDVSVSPDTLDLAPLQGAAVLVRFAPKTAGDRSTTLTMTSDDPDGPVRIPIAASAVAPPRISLAPDSLLVVVAPGGAATATVTVSNVGGNDLRWSAAPLDTVAWLTVLDPSGTLAAAAAAPIRARLDASSLEAGDYRSAIRVASDDPFRPEAVVPVRVHVGLVEAGADLTPATLQRGSRGQSVRARVTLPAGLDPARVVPGTVRLVADGPGSASAGRAAGATGVTARAGGLDLSFDRDAVLALLPDGDRVPVAVLGEVEGVTVFAARDTVRVTGRRFAAPGVEMADGPIPSVSALRSNAPNPFNPSTAIRFDVAGDEARATLRVFSAGGRLVRTLIAADLPGGRFVARWDGRDDAGRDAASGVYFCRLDLAGGGAPAFRASRRMLLLR